MIVVGEDSGGGRPIAGIPDLDSVDAGLREAGTEAWKLRAAARDTQEILSRCDTHTGRAQLGGDAYQALTETLPTLMETFAVLYDVGTYQFQYSAAGMHDSIDNPDRVAQQALRRYHLETARMLERIDALAERYLDMSLDGHAPMDEYTDRFRLEEDDFSTVVDGWTDELNRYTDAYKADGVSIYDDQDEEDEYRPGTSSF